MKSSFGQAIQINVFGESHGEKIGVVINGLAPGIKIDIDHLLHQLDLRKPKGRISTQRHESDEPHFVSGYFNGYTTGSSLCIQFDNSNTQSKDYKDIKDKMRPSHADYTANLKYHGYQDYRGGGHFSGRLTTALVAAGAICLQILESKGIKIGTHIKRIQDIEDIPFDCEVEQCEKQLTKLKNLYFPVLDNTRAEEMNIFIEQCANEGDSCGGILESVILNMPGGVGEPMFDSIESILSHLLFSIPAIKGIEFGLGFNFADYTGSEVNDNFQYQQGKVVTTTNHNGGINGGISNGMPIVIKSVVKPTPSIYKQQNTIDIETKENISYQIKGRHDPAIIHRARVVVDSMIAIGLLDLLVQRHGTQWIGE